MRSQYGDSIVSEKGGNRDAQLQALADSQRRRLLQYLLEQHPDPVPLSAAVAHLTGLETHNHQQVETVLVHRHLPRLDDAGLVSYDTDAKRIRYTGDSFAREVLALLR